MSEVRKPLMCPPLSVPCFRLVDFSLHAAYAEVLAGTLPKNLFLRALCRGTCPYVSLLCTVSESVILKPCPDQICFPGLVWELQIPSVPRALCRGTCLSCI